MVCAIAGLLMDFLHWEAHSNEEAGKERASGGGQWSRSEEGMITIQAEGKRAWITMPDVIMWRQSNELHSAELCLHDWNVHGLMVIWLQSTSLCWCEVHEGENKTESRITFALCCRERKNSRNSHGVPWTCEHWASFSMEGLVKRSVAYLDLHAK